MANTKFDARQTISRDLLPQLASATGKELDDLLRAIDTDISVPLRLDASNPADLIVTLGTGSTVINPINNRKKIAPHIGGVLPNYAAAETITFPAASGGTITFSQGNNAVLTVPSNEYIH